MTPGFLLRFLLPFRGGLAITVTEVAFVAGLVVGLTSRPYETAFYEAVSQIIPVLLLALAVEARYFRITAVSFGELREAFEAEVRKSIGEKPSIGGLLRAPFDIQASPTLAYVEERFLVALALASLVGGEAIAILVVGQPSLESSLLQGLVLGATFAGLGSVMFAALTGQMTATD